MEKFPIFSKWSSKAAENMFNVEQIYSFVIASLHPVSSRGRTPRRLAGCGLNSSTTCKKIWRGRLPWNEKALIRTASGSESVPLCRTALPTLIPVMSALGGALCLEDSSKNSQSVTQVIS